MAEGMTSVGGQGRPAVQVTSDQITAGGEKVNCVKLTQGEHPSLGTTEDKNWEQGELGMLKGRSCGSQKET